MFKQNQTKATVLAGVAMLSSLAVANMPAQARNEHQKETSSHSKSNPTHALVRELDKMGIDSSYNHRFQLADKLHKAGIVLFDRKSNPYFRDYKDGDPMLKDIPIGTWYIGTPEQNAKFLRNIRANRQLFNGGALPSENIKKWHVVK